MNQINLFRTKSFRSTPGTLDSVAWGKMNSIRPNPIKTNLAGSYSDTAGTMIFAALLIVCSLTIGCSSDQTKNDQPKPANPTTQAIMQPVAAIATAPNTDTAPARQAVAKPVHRRVARKAPATVTYADKTSGVSFQYPRRYALKTGDAASELVASGPVPMDFTQPGGVALATVALPGSTYPKSDLASAFFNVSVNKNLTVDQCSEFLVPQPNPAAPADPATQATAQLSPPISKLPISKLMIGDMELQSTETSAETATGGGTRETTSKYYHIFQNGACYEFALQVAANEIKTEAEKPSTNESVTKHVDRDEVFKRLERVLATVKISPIAVPEANPEVKANAQPASQEAPAQ